MERKTDTGISILVVGGGIAGLTFSIEAYRQGHHVRVIERRDEAKDFGEFIVITGSALRTPAGWPGFMEEAEKHVMDPIAYLHKFDDGELVGEWPLGKPGDLKLVIYRAKLHELLYEYARRLGIVTSLSTAAVGYFETHEKGGVLLSDGRRLEADVVVAADGVGSVSWQLVLGEKAAPISSGYAIHRTTYPVDRVINNPVLGPVLKAKRTHFAFYAGPDSHLVMGKTEKEVSWVLTHKDNDQATESWTAKDDSQNMAKFVDGWCPFAQELVKATPADGLLVWKLMWRDPQPKWVSPHGRVVQIGDAAHPILPTSGSGATIAMENSISLATCLRIGGKSGIPLATRVHNHLRFERVSCVQKQGFKTREFLHRTDWEVVMKSGVQNRLGKWQLEHDPAKYAEDNFEACANHLLYGKAFVNTNSVPGYEYKAWTVRELLAASTDGKDIQDEGVWM
ncbi:uncharacterized protein CTRU02_211311 [Colletotrichum truncatum]|uniref:Uncharacterized protein n=1 Tax=Colletotrichum truncatum TaxID=5467 RepID=A0ACC3YRL1_COLTU|nr:uncharacterized protein CTRU02_02086 [Colletotrichum truncatum]KAF6799215.1 hypothetical protein CTRU02_02086 [Colletotrichum truncatum]